MQTNKRTISHNTPDKQLSAAIKRSDADAFKLFYHRYFEPLFSFLWRRTRDYETSKDLTQEAFLKLWSHRRTLDPAQSIKAYLYRIANNLSIDHLRKRSVEAAYLAEERNLEVAIVQNEDPELLQRIHSVIENLPEPIRLVFTLNRFEGFKYREIAETLDISIKTVESRMSKALKILRKRLSPFLAILLSLHFFS